MQLQFLGATGAATIVDSPDESRALNAWGGPMVASLDNLSAHADVPEIVEWLRGFSQALT
ncbi:MAG: hypothetical protein WA159_06665 [Variovorax sp.]